MFISLVLYRGCNYNCSYCICKSKDKPNFDEMTDYKLVADSIKKHFGGGNIISIECSGEPFLYPNFVELCKELGKDQEIWLITNLTESIDKFIEEIDPKTFGNIYPSLHIYERKICFEFSSKCKRLKDAGFKVYPTQVYEPYLLDDFDRLWDYFRRNDFYLIPQRLKNKDYPAAYTPEHREDIRKYINICKENNIPTEYITDDFLHNPARQKGLRCYLGSKGIIINNDGTVYDCWYMKEPLSNIFVDTNTVLKEYHICNNDFCKCVEKNGV